MTLSFRILTACTALGLAVSPLAAEEVYLSFKFVTYDVGSMGHEVDTMEDVSLEATKSVAVATFEDGRSAFKRYVYITAGSAAPSTGFSTYNFENGDTILAAFTAAPTDDGFAGKYEVLGGSGAYAGATGTGEFTLVPTEWTDAMAWTGSFQLTLP